MASTGQSGPRLYRFGVYEVDPASGELRKSGARLRLQEQPFQILVAMLERPGQVVTREELQQRLWPDGTFVDYDHSLNTAVNKLREVLGDSAVNPRFVETLARRGYRFIAPVQVEGESPAPVTPPAPQPAADELPRAPRTTTRMLLALLQVMYLTFYVVALTRLGSIHERVDAGFAGAGTWMVVAAVVSATVGLPVRFYLFTALLFDYHLLYEKFRRIFALVLALDLLWAMSPFLLLPELGLGVALAAVAGLLFLPFSQRTLMRMAYATGANLPRW